MEEWEVPKPRRDAAASCQPPVSLPASVSPHPTSLSGCSQLPFAGSEQASLLSFVLVFAILSQLPAILSLPIVRATHVSFINRTLECLQCQSLGMQQWTNRCLPHSAWRCTPSGSPPGLCSCRQPLHPAPVWIAALRFWFVCVDHQLLAAEEKPVSQLYPGTQHRAPCPGVLSKCWVDE